MIEIIDFEDFKGKIPNTYGYISLGGFKLPDEFKEGVQNDYYKATCKIDEKKVDLIIVQAGYFCNSVIVLGDLTNIPGNFLVDQEELYTALKNKMEKLTPEVDNPWSIDWSGVSSIMHGTTSTTSTSGNNFKFRVGL